MSKSEDLFDKLAEAGVLISGDGELANLHMDASRHYGAYTLHKSEEDYEVAKYELRAAEETLRIFKETRDWKEESGLLE